MKWFMPPTRNLVKNIGQKGFSCKTGNIFVTRSSDFFKKLLFGKYLPNNAPPWYHSSVLATAPKKHATHTHHSDRCPICAKIPPSNKVASPSIIKPKKSMAYAHIAWLSIKY